MESGCVLKWMDSVIDDSFLSLYGFTAIISSSVFRVVNLT